MYMYMIHSRGSERSNINDDLINRDFGVQERGRQEKQDKKAGLSEVGRWRIFSLVLFVFFFHYCIVPLGWHYEYLPLYSNILLQSYSHIYLMHLFLLH